MQVWSSRLHRCLTANKGPLFDESRVLWPVVDHEGGSGVQEMQLRMHPSILGSGSSDKLWTTFLLLLVSGLHLSNKRHTLQTLSVLHL